MQVPRQSEKNLLRSNISSTRPHNMVNFGPLAAEIYPVVWGTPANLNGFRVFVALLHGTPVVGVSQILRRWTEGATSIRQGGHHVGPHSSSFWKFNKEKQQIFWILNFWRLQDGCSCGYPGCRLTQFIDNIRYRPNVGLIKPILVELGYKLIRRCWKAILDPV